MDYLFGWILFPIFSAILASNKNRSVFGWFLIGLFFGPFGLLVGLMNPPEQISTKKQNNTIYDIKVDNLENAWNIARSILLKYYNDNFGEQYKIQLNTDDEVYATGYLGNFFRMKSINKQDGKYIIIEALDGINFSNVGEVSTDTNEESKNPTKKSEAIDDFVKLAELYKEGLLTEEEFEAQKKKYLSAQ